MPGLDVSLLEHCRRRLVIVCIMLDLCSIASLASRSVSVEAGGLGGA